MPVSQGIEAGKYTGAPKVTTNLVTCPWAKLVKVSGGGGGDRAVEG